MGPLELKISVVSDINTIAFVQAKKPFVDLLLSFLTMPMSTIIKDVDHFAPVGIKSMRRLYKSVQDMHEKHMSSKECKKMLLNPRTTTGVQCEKLIFNVDNSESDIYYMCDVECSFGSEGFHSLSYYSTEKCQCGRLLERKCQLKVDDMSREDSRSGVFVNGNLSEAYMITDDLQIFPASNYVRFKVEFERLDLANSIVEEIIKEDVTREDVLQILHRALISDTPMTDVLLRKSEDLKEKRVENIEVTQGDMGSHIFDSSNITITLRLSKSGKEILCAVVGGDFINLLFSFLTIPLGALIKLWNGNLSMGSMDNIYGSVLKLSEVDCIKSQECKSLLLDPKVPRHFGGDGHKMLGLEEVEPHYTYIDLGRGTTNKHLTTKESSFYRNSSVKVKEQLLTLKDPKSSTYETASDQGFVKLSGKFLVFNDLMVLPYTKFDEAKHLKRFNLKFSDVEDRVVRVGAQEALKLLKSSLVLEKNVISSVFD